MGVWAVAAALGLMAPDAPRLVKQFGAPQWGELRSAHVEFAPGGRLARVYPPGGIVRHFDLAARAWVAPPAGPKLVGLGGDRFQLVGPAGAAVQTFAEPETYLQDGAWSLSPGGKYLRTVTAEGASVWRVATGEVAARHAAHKPYGLRAVVGDELVVVGPELSANGGRRNPCFLDRTDLLTGKPLPPVPLPFEEPGGPWAVAPGGAEAVMPGEAGVVRVDLKAMKVLPTLPLACRPFDACGFSHDSTRLAVVRRRQADLVVLDYPSGVEKSRVPLKLPREASAERVGFSASGDRVYVATREPALLIEFDAATGAEVARDDLNGPTPVDDEPVAFAGPVGMSSVVTVACGGRVRLINCATRAERRGELPPGRPVSAKVLPDGAVLAVLTKAPDGARRLYFCDLAAPQWKWVSTGLLGTDQDEFDAAPGGRVVTVALPRAGGNWAFAVYEAATGARRHLVTERFNARGELDPESGEHRPPPARRPPATADGRYEFDGRRDGFSVVTRADGRVVADAPSGASLASGVHCRDRVFLPAPRGHLVAVVPPDPRSEYVPPGALARPVRFFDARTWQQVAEVRPTGDEWGFTGDGRYFVTYGRGLARVYDVSRVGSLPPAPLSNDERHLAWAALASDADPAPPAPPKGGPRVVRRGVIDALWRLQHDPGAVAQLRLRLKPAPGEAPVWDSRAVDLLERIATPEARALLAEYAGGDPAARLTLEAQAALARLK